MPYCDNCGVFLDDNAAFCHNCGAATHNQNYSRQTSTNFFEEATTTRDHTAQFSPQDINDNRAYGILSYILFLWLVPMIASKNSPYATFHANQGLLIFIANVALSVTEGLFSAIHLGYLGAVLLAPIAIYITVLNVLGIVYASCGKAMELPLIGKIKLYK